MKVNKLQKGTTTIEIDNRELEALQELFALAQARPAKLMQRHLDFIVRLNMQLDRSNQDLLAQDKLHTLKERLKDALRISPERDKGILGIHYTWSIGYNPEKDFGIKIDCAGISLYISIGCKGSYLSKESEGIAHLCIRPHDYISNSQYIDLDHQSTIEAALAGKSRLAAYLKEKLTAYMTANPGRIKVLEDKDA
jgi:hypothetical protein